jgi:hypothetical protein
MAAMAGSFQGLAFCEHINGQHFLTDNQHLVVPHAQNKQRPRKADLRGVHGFQP